PLVGHHDVHLLLLHDPTALLGAMRLEDPEFTPEQVLHRVAHIRLIIHDQHAVPGDWHVQASSATLVPERFGERRNGAGPRGSAGRRPGRHDPPPVDAHPGPGQPPLYRERGAGSTTLPRKAGRRPGVAVSAFLRPGDCDTLLGN